MLTRRAALRGVLATAVGAATGGGLYGAGYERHHLGITRARLPMRELPAAFDGLRIALITDIHHSALVPAADVVRAVELANGQRPDLTLLGGDYVTLSDRAFMDPVAELLEPLRAPMGVFAIIGNHDDERLMPEALKRRRIPVLRDQRTVLTRRGDRLELVGLRFWTDTLRTVAPVVREAKGPVLLLAHDPRRLTEASELGIPGVLSGHTHGGQIVLPGLGALAARKYPVKAGNGARGDTRIFVSRGVGTVYVPIRLNCPPEVAIVTLEKMGSGVI